MWIKRAVQFLHPFSLSPDLCWTTLLTTSLHMLQGWDTFRTFCIIESHPRPYTSTPWMQTACSPWMSVSTYNTKGSQYPLGCPEQFPALNLKMYTAEVWSVLLKWPHIDIVVVAYPSALQLDLNTKQNSSHLPSPLLAPKYVLPQLCNRMVDRPVQSGATRRDLPFVKFVVTAWDLCIFPAIRPTFALGLRWNLRTTSSWTWTCYCTAESWYLWQKTRDKRRLKQLCLWSLRLRNQRPYVTASARTCQSRIFIREGPTTIPSRKMAITATIEHKARANYSMFAHGTGESTAPALVGVLNW